MFTITTAAIQRVAALCQTESRPYFRVSVDSGGCSGFQYVFGFADSVGADDTAYGQILVDAVSAPFLAGATLDYIDNLSGSRFAITNPNASTGCGCGTSFAV